MYAARSIGRLLFVVVFVLYLVPAVTQAKKPGGGGGGDGGGSSPYSLITLAPPGVSVISSWPTDLDETGTVVGGFSSGSQVRSFHYDSNQDSWVTFGGGIRILGLNNLGQLVGSDEPNAEALLWASPVDATPAVLAPLPGFSMASAVDINDAGLIIGQCFDAVGTRVAAAWVITSEGDVSLPVELPSPAGDPFASVYALEEPDSNGVIQIVGASGQSNPGSKAIRWEVDIVADQPVVVSGPTDLGSLGGESAAYGINVLGDVVGESGNWPFVKWAGQAMQPLSGIRKASYGYANEINNAGVIVGEQGYLSRGRAVSKAVIWTASNSPRELEKDVNLARGESLVAASQINDAGDIAGLGFFPTISVNGDVGFLLVPTP